MIKALVVVGLCVLMVFSAIVIQDWNNDRDNVKLLSDDDIEEQNNCQNFNSYSFLISGGSKTPTTFSEAQDEMRRLNWLCNGGE